MIKKYVKPKIKKRKTSLLKREDYYQVTSSDTPNLIVFSRIIIKLLGFLILLLIAYFIGYWIKAKHFPFWTGFHAYYNNVPNLVKEKTFFDWLEKIIVPVSIPITIVYFGLEYNWKIEQKNQSEKSYIISKENYDRLIKSYKNNLFAYKNHLLPLKNFKINFNTSFSEIIDTLKFNHLKLIFLQLKNDGMINDDTSIELLQNFKFKSITFDSIEFANINFSEIEFDDCIFNNVIFEKCNLSKCKIKKSKFYNCSFIWNNFYQATLLSSNFLHCYIFSNEFPEKVIFDNNTFIYSEFRNNTFKTTIFSSDYYEETLIKTNKYFSVSFNNKTIFKKCDFVEVKFYDTRFLSIGFFKCYFFKLVLESTKLFDTKFYKSISKKTSIKNTFLNKKQNKCLNNHKT